MNFIAVHYPSCTWNAVDNDVRRGVCPAGAGQRVGNADVEQREKYVGADQRVGNAGTDLRGRNAGDFRWDLCGFC